MSHKSHKLKEKGHISKKLAHSRSPVRISGSSRPPSMKRISPSMKRGHLIQKRKASHSPRLRSIASSPHRSLSHRSKPESPVPIDRARAMKSLKYEKRRHLSNSPVRHMASNAPRRPMSPHESRDVSPYMADRYQNSTIPRSQQYSPPPPPMRKKVRRSTSGSPPRRAPGPIHSDGHIPRRVASPVLLQKHRHNIPVSHGEREKHVYDMRSKQQSPPVMSRSHSKEASLKLAYPDEDRYRSASPSNRYSSSRSKNYAPTLHERFSSVIESNRTEPRIRYSREDLEKITIDIRRNVRDPSPPPPPQPPGRHGIIPSAHRPNEGRRPIFDREEIKQAPRHEEVYYERKQSSYSSSHAINLRNVENYQITRHQYDDHHDVFPSTSGRSLSDKWPNHEGRKEIISLDRDEREKDYERIPVARSRLETRSRSRSGDRDFRSDRYLDARPSSSSRAEYSGRPPPPPPIESSVPYPHRKSSVPVDIRHKLNFRKGERESHSSSLRLESKYLPPEHHHYPEDLPPPRVERRDQHSIPEPRKWEYRSRSPSREKIPEYSRRPDKYGYKTWADKPDISPRAPDYFEHEGREPPNSFRGSSRSFRSPRGFRSRGFRGPLRGGTYRGSFRGGYRNSLSPRGRGIPRR